MRWSSADIVDAEELSVKDCVALLAAVHIQEGHHWEEEDYAKHDEGPDEGLSLRYVRLPNERVISYSSLQ